MCSRSMTQRKNHMIALMDLEDMVSAWVVHWYMSDKGWTFQQGDGATGDDINYVVFLYQVYSAAKADWEHGFGKSASANY